LFDGLIVQLFDGLIVISSLTIQQSNNQTINTVRQLTK